MGKNYIRRPVFYREGERHGKNAILDLTGKQFGRLTVIEYAGSLTVGPMWKCRCECGNEIVISGKVLRKGKKESCGCLKRETLTEWAPRQGLTVIEHRLYNIFNGMWHRCYDPKTSNYADYGARGIYIDKAWLDPDDETHLNKLPEFIEWAYSHGYVDPAPDAPKSERLTIDRIDVNGPYAPWNCRWQYPIEQMNNRTVNMYIYDGFEWLTFAQFARKYNLGRRGYIQDKLRLGWDIHEIIYAATHPELDIRSSRNIKSDPAKYDKDGFIRIIPHVPGARILSADEYNRLMNGEG